MKKLFLVFLFVSSACLAQFNTNAPWMSKINDMHKSGEKVSFQNVVDEFNNYWETRDFNAKGSGFKVFKRWENHWGKFVKPDGTLPTSKELWDTWKQFKNSNRFGGADLSNWQPVGPFSHINTGSWSSGQGRINAITVDPQNSDTYYAGAPAGGIWKSTDAGLTWVPLSDFLPQIGISGIAVDHTNSSVIYIATGDDDGSNTSSVGVMKSIDGGSTWLATGLDINNTPSFMSEIYMHPTDNTILWIASSSGVYKTTDSGTTWTNTLAGNITDMKLNPGFPNTIYAASGNTFYKSINGGNSFTVANGNSDLPSGSGRLVIDVTNSNSNVVYVLSADNSAAFNGIYKSLDSGENFTTMATEATVGDIFNGSRQGFFDLAFGVSDVDEDEIYVGVLNVWKSTNGGINMTQLNNWNNPSGSSYTHADIHIIRFLDGKLFVGSDGGLYRSTNNGINFTDLTSGMQIGQFYRIAVSKNSSQKMVGGLQDNGGHALNNGQWQNYYGADGMDTAIDPVNSNLYYGFTQFGGLLNISNASGGNLSGQFGSPDNGNWITPLVMTKDRELYAGYTSLYRFSGSSWTQISQPFSARIDHLEIDDLDTNNIFVAVNDDLFRSIDKGVNFTLVSSFTNNITSIEINSSNSSIIYVTTSGPNGGVFKSNDMGSNFSDISGSLPNVSKNRVKHQDLHTQNPLFLATSLGVYRYDDTILDWELFNINLPNVSVTDLEINTNDFKITASTYGRGIWQSDIPIETPQDDIRLVELQNLNININCDGQVAPKVLVQNNGLNDVTSVNISYSLDQGLANSFTWNGTITSGNTELIDMPLLNLSKGLHSLFVSTDIANDTYPSNNSAPLFEFYINSFDTSFTTNTFESISDELLVIDEGDSSTQYWERGMPTGTLLNTAASGVNVYATNLSGNYSSNTKSYLISECYDLTSISNPILKFKMAFDLELDWDIIYVESSIDSGENWSVLGSASDLNWYNSNTLPGANCFNCPGAQWTGTNSTMTDYEYSLSSLSSESNVIFRFVFHSDQNVVAEGATIDDLFVEQTLSVSDNSINSFSIFPNPSKGIFNISALNMDDFDFNLYDVTGKLILQKKKNRFQNNTFQLNLSQFSSGIYFINLSTNGKTETKKLILN